MRITAVEFDRDENPKTVGFEMTVDEAAVMYALTACTAPKVVTDALGDVRWGNAFYDIADCLSGTFFNRFWDEGADAVIPLRRLKVVPAVEQQ